MPGPGHQGEISDSIELCIVELTRVDCILFWMNPVDPLHCNQRLNTTISTLYNIGLARNNIQ